MMTSLFFVFILQFIISFYHVYVVSCALSLFFGDSSVDSRI